MSGSSTGEKYYISGAGDPRCKIMITMVQDEPRRTAGISDRVTNPGADRRAGVKIREARCTCSVKDDAPHGHMHIQFDNVRVPNENVLLG